MMIQRTHRPICVVAIQVIVVGFLIAPAATAQEPTGPTAQARLRWFEGQMARYGGGFQERIDLSSPTATALANALRLIETSPLRGRSAQAPGVATGGSPTSSPGASSQSAPPIRIELPPHPPESQAPAAQWRPPIQVPDPSTIPSPPLSQAPPQQQRPPIQLPNPTGGMQARPPVDLPVIPLPPHPPESQAPRNQRG
jgi:hypothetical protein